DELFALCVRFRPRHAAVATADEGRALAARLRDAGVDTAVTSGAGALCELAAHPDADTVMAAIVGAAGLAPCLAAAAAGKRLLLANKEALVVGGALFMRTVARGGATLLPIDSEHSAIYQCLPENRSAWHERVAKIILTASGGPFRGREPATLAGVTPDQACAHPNWVMGRKISVDSATMMNKALEVIEAHFLFDLAPEQIEVVIRRASSTRWSCAATSPCSPSWARPTCACRSRTASLGPTGSPPAPTRSTGARSPRSPSSRPTCVFIPASGWRGMRSVRRPERPPCSTPPTKRRSQRFSPEPFASIGFTW